MKSKQQGCREIPQGCNQGHQGVEPGPERRVLVKWRATQEWTWMVY